MSTRGTASKVEPEGPRYLDGPNGEALILVWEITPDPQGAFDHCIVDSMRQAGELAAGAAEDDWDMHEGMPESYPGANYSIRCYAMPRAEFEALEEP